MIEVFSPATSLKRTGRAVAVPASAVATLRPEGVAVLAQACEGARAPAVDAPAVGETPLPRTSPFSRSCAGSAGPFVCGECGAVRVRGVRGAGPRRPLARP